MTAFIDTNVLFAAAYARDAGHTRAVRILGEISATGPFTTDHVLVETWALLASRAGWGAAMRFWAGLRETSLTVVAVTLADLERAFAIAETWADQGFDIVDCTSFAVMERVGCRRAATFDRDFAVFRHGIDRSRAFEILA